MEITQNEINAALPCYLKGNKAYNLTRQAQIHRSNPSLHQACLAELPKIAANRSEQLATLKAELKRIDQTRGNLIQRIKALGGNPNA